MAKKNTLKATTLTTHKIPLSLPDDLKQEVESTSAAIELSQQDTMRHALKRGLPILRQLLLQNETRAAL